MLAALVPVATVPLSARAEEARAVTPARFDVAWRVRLNEPGLLEHAVRERSSPVVDPARGWIFVVDRSGHLKCLEALGRLRWDVELGGPVDAGLVVQSGVLYVATVEGRVAAFDTVTGEEIWSYQGNNELATTPVLAGGLLLVPSLVDTLLALDAGSGEFTWFHRRARPADLTIRGAARPAVQGNRVVTGFSDGSVVALRLDDGEEIWSAEVGQGEHKDILASPVIRGERVYVASYSGSLHALDLLTGIEEWSRPAATSALGMVGYGDLLVVGAVDLVSAHRLSDGALLWQTRLAGGIPTSPLVHLDRIFVATDQGRLLALDAARGMPIAAFDTGTGASAAPIPAARGVWLWSNGGWLYRLRLPGF